MPQKIRMRTSHRRSEGTKVSPRGSSHGCLTVPNRPSSFPSSPTHTPPAHSHLCHHHRAPQSSKHPQTHKLPTYKQMPDCVPRTLRLQYTCTTNPNKITATVLNTKSHPQRPLIIKHLNIHTPQKSTQPPITPQCKHTNPSTIAKYIQTKLTYFLI